VIFFSVWQGPRQEEKVGNDFGMRAVAGLTAGGEYMSLSPVSRR